MNNRTAIVIFSMLIMLATGLPRANAQAGFLFGLGAGLLVGDSQQSVRFQEAMKRSGFTGIPFRCLFVDSEKDYMDCRWTSMMAELQSARNNLFLQTPTPYCIAVMAPAKYWDDRKDVVSDSAGHERACDVAWHIQLEIKALKALGQAVVEQNKN